MCLLKLHNLKSVPLCCSSPTVSDSSVNSMEPLTGCLGIKDIFATYCQKMLIYMHVFEGIHGYVVFRLVG